MILANLAGLADKYGARFHITYAGADLAPESWAWSVEIDYCVKNVPRLSMEDGACDTYERALFETAHAIRRMGKDLEKYQ